MPFIGNQPALSFTSFAKQDFSTSATTSYTLDNPVANANELALFINFVRQEPTTSYSASGTTLTLTSATASSDDMYCVYLGKAVQTVNPPNASVGLSQLTASGTKDATTFLRGDNTFAVAGGTNSPYFFTHKSSNQSVNDDTTAKVTFDASTFHSSSSVFDNTNDRFTVTSAGVYQLNAKATLESSGGGRFYSIELRIYKNGSQITGNVFHDRDDTNQDLIEQFTLSESTLVNASVNDYFEIFVYGDTESGDAWTINGSSTYLTTFSGYKLIG